MKNQKSIVNYIVNLQNIKKEIKKKKARKEIGNTEKNQKNQKIVYMKKKKCFYNLVQNLTAKENVELATQLCSDALNVDEIFG